MARSDGLRRGLGLRGVVVAAAAALGRAQVQLSPGNCFVAETSPDPPFSDDAIAHMRKNFLANINVQGKGAVVASPGAVPALKDCCPGGYMYHWTRDSALAMGALYKIAGSEIGSVGYVPGGSNVTKELLAELFLAYTGWEEGLAKSNQGSGAPEPKWDINTATPYKFAWCTPQTDGPALRATTLGTYALGDLLHGQPDKMETIKRLWGMVKYDLDWLASGNNMRMSACDIWEETRDWGFLFNEVVQRRALLQGVRLASIVGDPGRSKWYLNAARNLLPRPMAVHMDQGVAGSCRPGWGSCNRHEKDADSAVILAFVHSGWLELPLFSQTSLAPASLPTSIHVAKTVEAFNQAFCGAYPINRADTANGVPGVLYGRYIKDAYGGGNPWLLITAALASLLYQCAQVVTRTMLMSDELLAWRRALNSEQFGGLSADFIAAGDGVLKRLRHHINVPVEGWHLYEQIDKNTGAQYNAADLTWSYAEVLNALHERSVAMKAVAGGQSLLFT